MEAKNASTFVETVEAAPTRAIAVEVGDAKQAEFFPQFKSIHWDNECNFSARLVDAAPTEGLVAQKAATIEWSRDGRTARFYPKPTEDENGAFEFEVELAGPPASNVLEFSIQTKGFTFLFQPPLTEDQQDPRWATVTETEAFDKEGKRLVYRPENIVGSYAVFHATKVNNAVGGKEYRTGKAFHIYRPWAEDAKGTRVWCELKIDADAGLMTITIPQKFLDTAVYPLLVDPTFGYSTHGGTGSNVSTPNLTKFTPTEAGTITSITAWTKTYYGGGCNQRFAVYDDSAGTPVNKLAESGSAVAVAASNTEYSAATSYGFSGSTPYWLAMWTDNANADMAYDSGATHQSSQHGSGYTYPTWPATWGEVFALDRVYSIYATYTASGGGAVTTGNFFGLF